RPRAVAALRRRRTRSLGRLTAAAPLRRRTEERPGTRGELLLQALDLQLELRVVCAFRLRQRPGQLHQPAVEPGVLRLEEPRHLPQPLEIRLRRQPHHPRPAAVITLLACCQVTGPAGGVHVRGRTTPGESAVRVRSVQPSRKRLSSLSVSVRPGVAAPSGAQSAANRPCSSRLWYTQSPVPSQSKTFA